MAAQTEALILQMSVDIRRMEKSLAQVRGQTNRQLGDVEKRFDKMNEHIRRSGADMARDLRASFATIGVGIALREVTEFGDAWTNARNKLAAAGVTQERLAGTMSDLVDLAKATRSEFEGTVDLYAKLTRAGQQLNLTQEEVRKITETTLQAFVAGGAAASEQAAAITQLSQALGSGILQGDELKSIRENAPLLAQAIADEFKTTIAGLKDLGAEGKLTADRVAKAILNADGISDAFGKTITTVAQAMNNLRTEFTRYIAESRVAQTVIGALGGFIQFVTDNIDLLADAALVAASVIGGTLAVQAMGKFITSLRTMSVEAVKAGGSFTALRVAMTFLGGPIGAAILGIGGALLSMATNTDQSASAADRAAEAFGRVEKIQGEMEANQKALTAAQVALTEAIRQGGEAARIASTLEVDRLRKLLQGNANLLNIEKARAASAVRDRKREFNTKPVPVPGFTEEQSKALFGRTGDILGFGGKDKGLPLASQFSAFAAPELARRGVTGAQFSEQMAIKARTKDLTDQEIALLAIIKANDEYDQEIADLTQQLKDLDAIRTDLGDEAFVIPMPEGLDAKDGSKGGSASEAVRGYRTEVEKLADTLKALREAGQKDTDRSNTALFAVDSFNQMGNADADHEAQFYAEQAKRKDLLEKIDAEVAANAAARSREAIEAVLTLARSGEIAAAFAQIPSMSDILVGDDEGLLRAQLTQLATDASDAVAVGVDKIAADFKQSYEAIEKARAAAIAAGITDLGQFDRALQALMDTLDTDLTDRLDVPNPYDIKQLSEEMKSLMADNAIDWQVEGEEARQVMREAIKNALRDGIMTGDWDKAFASILAEAVTTGLDGALNKLGDFLGDLLFGNNGVVNSIASWASTAMFGRATGGSVYGGQVVKVGENGPETLIMGRGQTGQVLNASMTRDLAMGGGGGVTINAPLTIQGSVDAVTWPKLQAAMRQQAAQIMRAVPMTVRGTITDDRIQKRRY